MAIEMRIKGLMIDPVSNMPIIILKNQEESSVLPIWVGIFEANAIAMQLEEVVSPRPMTHDLLKNVIEGLQAEVKRVVITDLKENTFYAKLFVEKDDEIIGIDARPSDSIALALRTKSPIYVADELLRDHPLAKEMSDDERAEALRRYLDDLNPEDFGKFPP